MSLEVRADESCVLALFDADQLGVVRAPLGAAGDARSRPLRAAEALALAPDAACVIDGAFYDDCGAGCQTLLYGLRDARRGVALGSPRPAAGATLSVVGGQPLALAGAAVAPGASVAVQTDTGSAARPVLVLGGEPVGPDGSETFRAALGIHADGRLFFAVAPAVTERAFAGLLAARGAVWAGNLDGGGSARLTLRSGEWWGSPEDRAVASWLVAGEGGGGGGALPWLLGGVTALGLAAWLWRS